MNTTKSLQDANNGKPGKPLIEFNVIDYDDRENIPPL